MACPNIITGDQFVTRVLTHIDCQSRFLGSYGYEALGEPGSVAVTGMTGLLTLFVALWGIRLLFGPMPGARDVTYDVIKIGIVLTLAFSWPAFRIVIHDVVLDGPAEIASVLANPGLGATTTGFVERLQNVDNAVVQLTDLGTGRSAGQLLDGDAGQYRYAGTALQDESALGWSRLIYLSGMFGSLALLRLIAGLLLAVAPLAAGLLLFETTRGIFAGWMRGLVLTLLGSVGVTVIIAIELAVLEPWLRDALLVRSQGYAVTSAPIELFAMTLAFAIVQFGAIWLLAKVAFMHGWPTIPVTRLFQNGQPVAHGSTASNAADSTPAISRASRISEQVETRMEFERNRMLQLQPSGGPTAGQSDSGSRVGQTRLGSSRRLGATGRRTGHAASLSARRRDRTT